MDPLGSNFAVLVVMMPSISARCRPRRAIDIVAPSISPRRPPRRAVAIAALSTSPRHRPRRAIDLAASSTSRRPRPRRAVDIAAASPSLRHRPPHAVHIAAPTGRSPGYPPEVPQGTDEKLVIFYAFELENYIFPPGADVSPGGTNPPTWSERGAPAGLPAGGLTRGILAAKKSIDFPHIFI